VRTAVKGLNPFACFRRDSVTIMKKKVFLPGKSAATGDSEQTVEGGGRGGKGGWEYANVRESDPSRILVHVIIGRI